MEATNIINSSSEDFERLGQLIHWHRSQRLLKTSIKEEKKKSKEKTWKYIYIVYIYIKLCYLSHHVFLFFKVFWRMILGSNTTYKMCDFFALDKKSLWLEQRMLTTTRQENKDQNRHWGIAHTAQNTDKHKQMPIKQSQLC